jgi:hypothetical protein
LLTLWPAADDEGAACLPELAVPIDPVSALVDILGVPGALQQQEALYKKAL